MTREDIVNSMSLEDAIQVFRDTNCYGTMDIAKTVILRALEQVPILDKIRMEIKDLAYDEYDDYCLAITDALTIIDKYKVELWFDNYNKEKKGDMYNETVE